MRAATLAYTATVSWRRRSRSATRERGCVFLQHIFFRERWILFSAVETKPRSCMNAAYYRASGLPAPPPAPGRQAFMDNTDLASWLQRYVANKDDQAKPAIKPTQDLKCIVNPDSEKNEINHIPLDGVHGQLDSTLQDAVREKEDVWYFVIERGHVSCGIIYNGTLYGFGLSVETSTPLPLNQLAELPRATTAGALTGGVSGSVLGTGGTGGTIVGAGTGGGGTGRQCSPTD